MASAIVLSAELGNVAAVLRLLSTGAVDIDARDGSRRTALHAAAAAGHAALVAQLLQRGADPTLRDNAGRTPFAASLFAPQFLRPVASLLAHATLPAQTERGAVCDLTLLPALLAQLAGIASLDGAVLQAAHFLLELGAPVDVRDKAGHTTLMLLCRRCKPAASDLLQMYLPLLWRLIRAGADLRAVDSNGLSVMRHAMSSGSAFLVNALVQRLPGFYPSAADFEPLEPPSNVVSGYNPLMQSRGRPAAPGNHLLLLHPLSPAEKAAAQRRQREGLLPLKGGWKGTDAGGGTGAGGRTQDFGPPLLVPDDSYHKIWTGTGVSSLVSMGTGMGAGGGVDRMFHYPERGVLRDLREHWGFGSGPSSDDVSSSDLRSWQRSSAHVANDRFADTCCPGGGGVAAGGNCSTPIVPRRDSDPVLRNNGPVAHASAALENLSLKPPDGIEDGHSADSAAAPNHENDSSSQQVNGGSSGIATTMATNAHTAAEAETEAPVVDLDYLPASYYSTNGDVAIPLCLMHEFLARCLAWRRRKHALAARERVQV